MDPDKMAILDPYTNMDRYKGRLFHRSTKMAILSRSIHEYGPGQNTVFVPQPEFEPVALPDNLEQTSRIYESFSVFFRSICIFQYKQPIWTRLFFVIIFNNQMHGSTVCVGTKEQSRLLFV